MGKRCFKCGVLKPLTEFYKHRKMLDGHLNKCKGCTKSDASQYRAANIEAARAYDRNRPNKQARSVVQQEYTKEYREKFPNKYKAHVLVNNYLRDGKLLKEPCEVCSTNECVVAHHDDYAKPLDVRWLCEVHHKEWHSEHGEGSNGT